MDVGWSCEIHHRKSRWPIQQLFLATAGGELMQIKSKPSHFASMPNQSMYGGDSNTEPLEANGDTVNEIDEFTRFIFHIGLSA